MLPGELVALDVGVALEQFFSACSLSYAQPSDKRKLADPMKVWAWASCVIAVDSSSLNSEKTFRIRRALLTATATTPAASMQFFLIPPASTSQLAAILHTPYNFSLQFVLESVTSRHMNWVPGKLNIA